MTSHVGMDGEARIDPPEDRGATVCFECQGVVSGVPHKTQASSELLPVVFVGLSHAGTQERDRGEDIRPCSFSKIGELRGQMMIHDGSPWIQFGRSLVYMEQMICCGGRCRTL